VAQKAARFKDLEKAVPKSAFHIIDIDAEQVRQYIRQNAPNIA